MSIQKPIIYDSADKTPPIPSRVPHHMIGYGDVPRVLQPPAISYLPWPAWVVAGVIILVFGGWVMYWLRQFWLSISDRYPFWSQWSVLIVLSALILIGIYWLGGKAAWSVMRSRADAYQMLIARTRLGVPIAADEAALASWGDVTALEIAHISMQQTIAPHQKWPLLSTNAASSENAETTIYGAGEEPTAAPIDPQAGPLLAQLRKRYGRSAEHLLVGTVGDTPIHLRWGAAGLSAIAGGSGGGKTNTTRLIAAWHALNGGGLALCDGHGEVDEGLIPSCAALSSAFVLPPAVKYADIHSVIRRMDAIGRARINGTEPKDIPLLLVIDEFTSLCRNHASAAELINCLLNFGDEYRKVNLQALIIGHHWRGDLIDKQLGAALRSAIGTRIIHATAPEEARFLLRSQEAQGVDRLRPGEALFFDRSADVQKIVVPWLPPEALREVAYPLHPGWPLPIETPAEQQRTPRQAQLDAVRRKMERSERVERLRVALELASRGAKQREIQYACCISDEAAGAAWRKYHGG